jgi:hypothetical protein
MQRDSARASPFTFESICRLFDFDPEAVRAKLFGAEAA